MKVTHFFTFGSVKYPYTLERVSDEFTHFICEKLDIDQEFLSEDITDLLLDLPNIALNLKEHEKKQTTLKFRLSVEEKQRIEKNAVKHGYTSSSSYLRSLALAG